MNLNRRDQTVLSRNNRLRMNFIMNSTNAVALTASTVSLAQSNSADSNKQCEEKSDFVPNTPRMAHVALNARRPSVHLVRRRELRLIRICVGIVSMFVCCHIWRLIPTLYEAIFDLDGTESKAWPLWLEHVSHLSHTLIVLNSSVNILLYIVL